MSKIRVPAWNHEMYSRLPMIFGSCGATASMPNAVIVIVEATVTLAGLVML
jgi:hypothetical protein